MHANLYYTGGRKLYTTTNQRLYGINKEVEYLDREGQRCLQIRPTEYVLLNSQLFPGALSNQCREFLTIYTVSQIVNTNGSILRITSANFLVCITRKQAEEVVNSVDLFVGPIVTPKTIERDIGRKFKGVLPDLPRIYGITVINGRPSCMNYNTTDFEADDAE